MHAMLCERAVLASLRSRSASLFTSSADTMRSFFAQPDHMGVFQLHSRLPRLHEDLNMISMIGTSDRLVGWQKLVKTFFFF